MVLMMGLRICFYREIWLIIPKLSLLPLLIWSTAFYYSLAAPASPVPVVGAEDVIDLEQQDIDRLQKTADDQRQEVIANVVSHIAKLFRAAGCSKYC